MDGDRVLTPDEAAYAQWLIIRTGRLPMWTVTARPSDYPDKFVARVAGVGNLSTMSHSVLVADDLETLRAMLPPDLVCMARDPGDNPAIVEVWI